MPGDLQKRINDLRNIGKRIQPNESWVKATRETLLMQVKNSLPTGPVKTTERVKSIYRHFIPAQVAHLFRGPLVAAMSVLVIALGGSVASVSAAEQALPGDFLYTLKLATEQARLALTSASDEKLKLKLEFTSRRGDELKGVAKQNNSNKQERVVQAAEILKRDLNTVKKQLEDVRNGTASDKVVEVARLVDKKTNEIVQSLQLTKAEIPVEAKEKVTEAQVAAADTGVKAIEVMIEKNQESGTNIEEGEVVEAMQKHSQTIADATVEGSLTVTSTSPVLTITTVSSSMPLTEAVEQMKTVSSQAFAAQKTAEQIQVIAATSSTISEIPLTSSGTSTDSGVESTNVSSTNSNTTSTVITTTTTTSISTSTPTSP